MFVVTWHIFSNCSLLRGEKITSNLTHLASDKMSSSRQLGNTVDGIFDRTLHSEGHEHAIENAVVMISLEKRFFSVLAPPRPSMTVLFSTAALQDRYGRELSKASINGQLFRKFKSFKGY